MQSAEVISLIHWPTVSACFTSMVGQCADSKFTDLTNKGDVRPPKEHKETLRFWFYELAMHGVLVPGVNEKTTWPYFTLSPRGETLLEECKVEEILLEYQNA